MTAALSAEQRSLLETLIQKARLWLEDDLAESLEGRFGIHLDGRLEPEESLSLRTAQRAARADLVEVINYLRSEGKGRDESVNRLVREAAFTHLNRIIAVRIAEAVEIIPPTISEGLSSAGFQDFAELASTAASTEWERFSILVNLCADELSADVPALFDPRNPLLALAVSESVFAKLIESITELPDEIWAAPDALGWTYQFFNTSEERRRMREESVRPRTSRELAVRNQFFTPNYVVEFLVQNGLGTYLTAGFPALADELLLLVEIPTEHIDINLAEVSVLDPACGSGHFLLGAYDLLEKVWQHAGVQPADAAPKIVRSLWGIDIDPRCTQIAQAAVIFRARRHCRDPLPTPNVICARALPTGPEAEEIIAGLPDHIQRTVRVIAEELKNAPVLGPLLKIETTLSQEVRDIFGTGVIEGTLAESVPRAKTDPVRKQILSAINAIASSVTSTAPQRLFAAEVHDAVRFVEAMNRHYTAVLMNPPFGEPIPETKSYLKATYPWIPTQDYNLLAAFVGRGLELSQPDSGTCSAITSRAGMFLRTFEAWRQQVLLENELLVLADLGSDIMEQALVEAAAYVIRKKPDSHGTATFIRLLKEVEKSTKLQEVIVQRNDNLKKSHVFQIPLSEFNAIQGSPIAYWMNDSIRHLFRTIPILEQNGALLCSGLSSGDNFRFLRTFWEVNAEFIGYSSDDIIQNKSWIPFAKGGKYSPWWSDIHLLIDWENNGERIKAYNGSRVINTQHFFRPALTWPRRTISGFGVRLMPSGSAFDSQGPVAIPIGNTTYFTLLGWLSSRLIQAVIDTMVAAGGEVSAGGAARTYEVGLMKKLPWLNIPMLAVPSEALTSRRAHLDESDEITRRFVRPLLKDTSLLDDYLLQLKDGEEIDRIVNEAAGLDENGLSYLDQEIGPYPLSYPERDDLDDRISNLYKAPIKQITDELIEERGGSRAIVNLTYVADRRIEVIAHGLEVNPRSIVRVVKEHGLAAPGEAEDNAFRLISYLMGVCFGRWDVRIGRDSSRAEVPDDLFAPPARYSPGTLLDADGRVPKHTPEGYPIDLPLDGLLLDQPGHRWDIETAVRTAGYALLDSEKPVNEALNALMKRQPSLKRYLRSYFFKRHLQMYTISRRKAPIYWQLQVPSKDWGIWLYAPRLSREMLFAVAREAEQRQRLAQRQIRHLQHEAESSGSIRRASEVAKELDTEQRLAVELDSFRAEAERIANLGWEPDLNDGIVLNAAPLAPLFPAWRDAEKYQRELRAGKYEWASVSRWADRL